MMDANNTNSAFLIAINQAKQGLAKALMPDVDWRLFDAANSPVAHILENSLWAMDPLVFMEKARDRGSDLTLDELPEFARQVMHWCIDGDRSDLIKEPYITFDQNGNPVSQRHPIFACTLHGDAQGVLMCLEQGGEPDAVVEHGHLSARNSAKIMEEREICRVINSFTTRKMALWALVEATGAAGVAP